VKESTFTTSRHRVRSLSILRPPMFRVRSYRQLPRISPTRFPTSPHGSTPTPSNCNHIFSIPRGGSDRPSFGDSSGNRGCTKSPRPAASKGKNGYECHITSGPFPSSSFIEGHGAETTAASFLCHTTHTAYIWYESRYRSNVRDTLTLFRG